MNALVLNLLSHNNSRKAFERLLNNRIINNILAIEFNYKINSDRVKIIDFDAAIQGDILSDDEVGEVDGQVLEQLFECEAIFLKMYDRLDYSNKSKYKIRKDFYLKQVANWNKLLDKERVDICFFSNFPHELYDYVIYCLCKLKKIKTIIVDEIVMLPNTVFLVDDYKKHCEKLSALNNSLFTQKTTRGIEYFKIVEQSKTPTMPVGIILQKKQDSYYSSIYGRINHLFKSLPKIFKNINIIFNSKYAYQYNPYLIYKSKILNKIYGKLSIKEINLNCKYIYFPLHYQPECTTSPQAGVFVEQYLIAQMVANSLPKGYVLYVKEHPLQRLHGRYVSLYENIARLPNTYLINESISSYDLIRNAKAIATATGTAGWEAILNGVKVLCFGNIYYMYAPGVYRIRSIEDLLNAYSKFDESIDFEKLKLFIKNIDLYSINTWIHGFNLKSEILDTMSAVNNLYLGLCNIIKDSNDQ